MFISANPWVETAACCGVSAESACSSVEEGTELSRIVICSTAAHTCILDCSTAQSESSMREIWPIRAQLCRSPGYTLQVSELRVGIEITNLCRVRYWETEIIFDRNMINCLCLCPPELSVHWWGWQWESWQGRWSCELLQRYTIYNAEWFC